MMKCTAIIFTLLVSTTTTTVFAKRSRKLENLDCDPTDYRFDFTDCDALGQRWRVAIPNEEGCLPPIPPKRVNECYKSCEAGQFLNLTTVECQACQEGTYSMGGGVRFDEWDPMPTGFKTQVERFHNMFSPVGRYRTSVNCSLYGWHSKGGVLMSRGGPCVASLTYASQLVKPGQLKFTYQYADDTVLFQFQASSDQCENLKDAENNRWPPMTGEGIWRTEIIPLHPGMNIFEWKTIGIDIRGPKPILIKSIEIDGVGYTSSCKPCTPGYYADKQASQSCIPCPRNTYSDSYNATRCKPCDTNMYYSEPGSSTCLPRPQCTEADYYQLHTPCSQNNQMQTIYKWLEPKICLAGQISLPPPGEPYECPPCNPGTEYKNGKCVFCRPNEFSDGLAQCHKCPPKYVPNSGNFFIQWYTLPPNVHMQCISPEDNGCSESPAWQLNGKYIQSGKGHSNSVYLVITVTINGFQGRGGMINGELLKVGRIDFSFEMSCSSDCELLLMQSTRSKNASVVQRWTGSQAFQKFSQPVVRNDTYNFSWAFQKLSWDSAPYDNMRGWSGNSQDSASSWGRILDEENWVRIYNINITNTMNSGGDSCIPCREGGTMDGAMKSCKEKCPLGHYLPQDEPTNVSQHSLQNTTRKTTLDDSPKCIKCPKDRPVTKDPYAFNVSACYTCGPNLISHDGFQCTTDCLVHLGDLTYDLRPLSGFYEVKGSSLFTASGTLYYHVFNISFCTNKPAQCFKNVSIEQGPSSVNALVCQSTVFPPTVSSSSHETSIPSGLESSSPRRSYLSDLILKPLSTHATSIADHIVGISYAPTIAGVSVAQDIHDEMRHPRQFHFFFTTPEKTNACPKGRSTTITFRCKVMEQSQWASGNMRDEGIKPIKNCPDGTCDGCSFHFLWETPYACHLCQEDEVTVVRGDCKDGYQDIHYLAIPKTACYLAQNASWPKVQKCEGHLPFDVEVAIIGLLLLFSIVLICYHQKHRKLEYKYMKLVASSSSANPNYTEEAQSSMRELPLAETCGLDPNDEDDDDNEIEERLNSQMKEIRFYKEGSIKSLVSKLPMFDKLKALKRRAENNSEILSLTDKEAVS